jgi:hypothetical protein
MGFFSSVVSWAVKSVLNLNPVVALVVSIGIAWLMRPKVPENQTLELMILIITKKESY